MGNAEVSGDKKSKRNKGGKKPLPSVKDIPKGRLVHDPEADINQFYEIDKIIGKGNFSVVKIGTDKETKTKVAIKVIDKNHVKHKPDMLKNEVEVLLKLTHPNIIQLIDLFDSPGSLYLVMDLVTGGELFDRIVEKEQYTEEDAKEVMRQLFDAIQYIHSQGIVHRDLKPENLLLETDANDTRIKLTDFGLSRIYDQQYMLTACGTPGYVAPEILKASGYSTPVDMWSSGVILYILLCGYPPFYSENDAQLFESILNANYHFHSPYWDNVSKEAKDLIRSLLVPEPEKRLTATQALEAEWFKKTSDIKPIPLPEVMKEKLIRHNTERKSMVQIAPKKKD